MAIKACVIEVDELDYEAIQKEIAHRTECAKRMGVTLADVLPDGESNELGAVFAECCRSLVEYRDLHANDESAVVPK